MNDDTLAPGTRLDRYVIESRIGHGGMGVVYRARHSLIQQPVVLKVLHRRLADDGTTVARLLREAQAAAQTGSPHIVRVTDYAHDEAGRPFLVMELLEGRDLETVLAAEGPLSVERAFALGLQMLAGIGAAHAAGIVHRDLKPANVFITRGHDGREHVKLLDFGISKVIEGGSVENLTRTGVLLGTPSYMAPEQFMRSADVDRRADLYSLAVMLYEMLARELPHTGRSLTELLSRVVTEPPRPLAVVAPHLPPPVIALIERGLARDPDARYSNAAEMAESMRAVLAGRSLPGVEPTQPMPARSSSTPHAFAATDVDPRTPSTASSTAPSPRAASPVATIPKTATVPIDPLSGPSVSLAHGAPAATVDAKTTRKLGLFASLFVLSIWCVPLAVAGVIVAGIVAYVLFATT